MSVSASCPRWAGILTALLLIALAASACTGAGETDSAKEPADPAGASAGSQLQQSASARDVNCYSSFDSNDICYAIEEGDVKRVRQLAESGADVDVADDLGEAALAKAIQNPFSPNLEIIRILIDAGADANAETSFHGSLLHAAITLLGEHFDPADHTVVVEMLVKAGADVNWTDDPGYPEVLAGAVRTGNPEIVRIIVEAGASAHTEPFRVSLFDGVKDPEIIRLLADAGADPAGHELEVAAASGSATAREKNDALASAALNGDAEAVRTWIDQGADVNAVNAEGDTVLDFATYVHDNRNLEVVRLLVESGADVNAGAPLYNAAIMDDPELVRYLVDAGADVDAVNPEEGWTPLHAAANRGRTETVRVLVDAGADVNAGAVPSGDPPLHWAVRADEPSLEIVRMLLNAGAEVNARGKETFDGVEVPGPSVLHRAVRGDNPSPEIVQMLLDAGADVNAEDAFGDTVLHEAVGGLSKRRSQPRNSADTGGRRSGRKRQGRLRRYGAGCGQGAGSLPDHPDPPGGRRSRQDPALKTQPGRPGI